MLEKVQTNFHLPLKMSQGRRLRVLPPCHNCDGAGTLIIDFAAGAPPRLGDNGTRPVQ